jgi:mycothiol synthase
MIRRTYSGEADLKLLQDFNAAALAITDHCGYLHPGDIPHHIYNGNKRYDPVELMTIWEDDQGMAAWLLADPSFKCFDAQVRPALREGSLERDVLERAYNRTTELMRQHQIASDYVYADAFQGDTARSEFLVALGWEPDNESSYVLNRIEIDAIDVPALPEGFSFRLAQGIEDAAALAAVHNAAFNPTNWTPELYRKVMQSPGYAPERELVIQAPDGTFVAFAVTWYDHLNRTGLFEPVGRHREYQCRGFGRAIMLYGLQQMAAAGMKFASVAHFGDNEAARGLYQACGFKPWHLLDGYKKHI